MTSLKQPTMSPRSAGELVFQTAGALLISGAPVTFLILICSSHAESNNSSNKNEVPTLWAGTSKAAAIVDLAMKRTTRRDAGGRGSGRLLPRLRSAHPSLAGIDRTGRPAGPVRAVQTACLAGLVRFGYLADPSSPCRFPLKIPPRESAGFPTLSEFIALHNLVAARDCKGWG
jgi:hypothetical protein